MRVLIHHTVNNNVKNYYSRNVVSIHDNQFEEFSNFYAKCALEGQEKKYFVINFKNTSTNNIEHICKEIRKDGSELISYSITNEETQAIIDMLPNHVLQYVKGIYYEECETDQNNEIVAISFSKDGYKVKTSLESWTLIKMDLIQKIFDPIIDKMLDKNSVIHLLAAYKLQGLRSDESNIYENVIKYIPDEIFFQKMINTLEDKGMGASCNITSPKVHGDIGEYIMNIIIGEIFEKTKIEVIIPKIIYKTTTFMPTFGEDNVYYSEKENLMYLGEAKFYKDLKVGLNNAVKGIEERIASRKAITFIDEHTSHIKSTSVSNYANLMELIDSNNLINDETIFKGIIFVMCEDKYELKDVEKAVLETKFEGIIVILPVLDKGLFLQRYKERIGEYTEKHSTKKS